MKKVIQTSGRRYADFEEYLENVGREYKEFFEKHDETFNKLAGHRSPQEILKMLRNRNNGK